VHAAHDAHVRLSHVRESLAAYIVRVAFGAPDSAARRQRPTRPAPERAGEVPGRILSIEDQLQRKLAQYDV